MYSKNELNARRFRYRSNPRSPSTADLPRLDPLWVDKLESILGITNGRVLVDDLPDAVKVDRMLLWRDIIGAVVDSHYPPTSTT